jgi:3-deoxy-D-arabino-heptulosonate 7-phosphate (DAHP) synthase class II
MGTALLNRFNIADLFTPLQSLAGRWIPARRRSSRLDAADLRYVGIRPSHATREGPSVQPLRVIRTIDAREPNRHPSRMVISGRMADVCAELDRLAALEAADHRARAH